MDKKWGKLDLNQRPAGYESAALTDWAIAPRGNRSLAGISLPNQVIRKKYARYILILLQYDIFLLRESSRDSTIITRPIL